MANKKIWLYSPGENARKWEDCLVSRVMSIGWDELGDLSTYGSREDMREKLIEINGFGNRFTNDSLATWQFANEIQIGDIIFAKKGRNCIIGMGTVQSMYKYDDSRDEYKSIVDVDSNRNNQIRRLCQATNSLGTTK